MMSNMRHDITLVIPARTLSQLLKEGSIQGGRRRKLLLSSLALFRILLAEGVAPTVTRRK